MSSEGEELNEEDITDEAAMKAHLAERERNRGRKYEGVSRALAEGRRRKVS